MCTPFTILFLWWRGTKHIHTYTIHTFLPSMNGSHIHTYTISTTLSSMNGYQTYTHVYHLDPLPSMNGYKIYIRITFALPFFRQMDTYKYTCIPFALSFFQWMDATHIHMYNIRTLLPSTNEYKLLLHYYPPPITPPIHRSHIVTLRSRGYGDVTATYTRRSGIPLRIYANHLYRKESEAEA